MYIRYGYRYNYNETDIFYKGEGVGMNITITGNLGSGKSSVAKILKEKGYEYSSTGNAKPDTNVINAPHQLAQRTAQFLFIDLPVGRTEASLRSGRYRINLS